MPFIPHTRDDIQAMLSTIGVNEIEQLFDEIPADLRSGTLDSIPEAMSEMEITRLMTERANMDGMPLNFIGAGAYEHHIPAAVWQLATRGEYYTAYTPYQAEASQGTLQLIYEYQSMMTGLTGMDVSNASLYDGASALAEAVLMSIRINRKSRSRRILVPKSVNPVYRKVIKALCGTQDIHFEELDFDRNSGQTPLSTLEKWAGQDVTALVIPQPNFFGVLEEVDEFTQWANENGAVSIALVNPLLSTVLKPPGDWGEEGADIAVGDGQPLGVPLSSGGPYYGFMCCKQKHVRQMPGRIVGKTVDADNKEGFVLTLQAREQHIRRSRATSNICTNQGLVVTASTIHMTLMGAEGLERVAAQCYQNTSTLVNLLAQRSITPVFNSVFFHEVVIGIDKPAKQVLAKMADEGVIGGYDVSQDYPELENAILLCATETKTDADMQRYVDVLIKSLG
jgi:glycine dehydrogenase subunit 1